MISSWEASRRTPSTASFWTGKAAHDTNDRVIYTASSGALYYDPDGTGAVAKIKIAQLSKNLDLVASDFFAI
ncbi:hypothetical protein AB0L20_32050 [Streptomyces albidoflavus]|uniref:hypothetical protein n=1 Tax=Streptomyces albidoflavus TaxID=1886 RepID=UPI00341FAE23